jgi:hypothetical protein
MRNVVNIPGWSTKRKLIVFESDDWGSIRMSSKSNRDALVKAGFSFEGHAFNLYDALESNDDLAMLFEVLSGFTDATGRNPVFTAVSITGNPDFEKIKASGFSKYYWEPFTDTLARYPQHDKVYGLYQEGIGKRLFHPVFHGREHLNVLRWLSYLQSGNKSVLRAFESGVTGIYLGIGNERLADFQAAFEPDSIADLPFMEQAIHEGLDAFERLWNFQAAYFVPPNGPFHNSLEKVLHEKKVRFILAERRQQEPLGDGKYRSHFHYIGMRNKWGQTYLTRNGFFEPSVWHGGLREHAVDKCMLAIERAFRWNKPAIISSHRVNYAGFIDPENRGRSLRLLSELLYSIRRRWPEAEFMTSTELGDLIYKERNRN